MTHPTIPLDHESRTDDEVADRARRFYDEMERRRSVRDFSDRPVPRAVIEDAIRAASTAPVGRAHAAVDVRRRAEPRREAADPRGGRGRGARELRRRHRGAHVGRVAGCARAAGHRLPKSRFSRPRPSLVVLFAQRSGRHRRRLRRRKHYYVQESCGIAAGLFIAALHHAGLVTLTHTPSPMRFLREILGRPANEAPMILFPVGFPADGGARARHRSASR